MYNKIAGVVDDTKLGIAMLVFSIFALVVLSQTVGLILLAYGMTWLWAVSRKPAWAFQHSQYPRKITNWLGVPLAIFIAYVLVNDFILGQLGTGSSLQLYSSAISPIITIDNPVVRLGIWGILIPLLETVFFIGVVGFIISKQLTVTDLDASKADTYVVIVLVGAIAAAFHFVSQLTNQSLLIMDMILFGTGMALTLKYKELKQAAVLHMLINSVVVLINMGWI